MDALLGNVKKNGCAVMLKVGLQMGQSGKDSSVLYFGQVRHPIVEFGWPTIPLDQVICLSFYISLLEDPVHFKDIINLRNTAAFDSAAGLGPKVDDQQLVQLSTTRPIPCRRYFMVGLTFGSGQWHMRFARAAHLAWLPNVTTCHLLSALVQMASCCALSF